MPYHPELSEVLDYCDVDMGDWVEFSIFQRTWSVWVSCNDILGDGEIENHYVCSRTKSSHSSYANRTVFLKLETCEQAPSLTDIDEERPFGSFSYYSDDEAIITLRVSEELDRMILDHVSNTSSQIRVRIEIPTWSDSECKMLPLTQYQIFATDN